MNATQFSMDKLEELFKANGGTPLWRFRGSFGEIRAWFVAGEFRLIHRLQGDNGVEVYEPIVTDTFEELLQVVLPETEPAGDCVNGCHGNN